MQASALQGVTVVSHWEWGVDIDIFCVNVDIFCVNIYMFRVIFQNVKKDIVYYKKANSQVEGAIEYYAELPAKRSALLQAALKPSYS